MRTVRLPGVGWLYVHRITIALLVDGQTADAEGRTSDAWGEPVGRDAYVAAADRADIDYGGGAGVQVDAVARVAHGVPSTPGSKVVIAGVDPALDGEYTVDLVRPTVVDRRLLLVRRAPGQA